MEVLSQCLCVSWWPTSQRTSMQPEDDAPPFNKKCSGCYKKSQEEARFIEDKNQNCC